MVAAPLGAVESIKVLPGLAGLMMLKTLNASIRNSTATVSRIGKVFINERSALKRPGPVKAFLGEVPVWSRLGLVKAPPNPGRSKTHRYWSTVYKTLRVNGHLPHPFLTT